MLRVDSKETENIEICQDLNRELENLGDINIEVLYAVMIPRRILPRKLKNRLNCN